jgi:hypothetical protein
MMATRRAPVAQPAERPQPFEDRVNARLGWTGWLGISAATVYVGATAAGSMLDPSYSQIRQHVSDLTAAGAATWIVLVVPYVAYNTLVFAFGISMFTTSARTWPWRIGLALLTLNALAGVGMVTLFREDLGGVPTSFAGAGHLVLAGVSSFAIVLASIAFGLAFRRSRIWHSVSVPSFAIAIGFAILGPLAVLATASKSDLAGLAERGPIGLFVAWLALVGWFALGQSRRTVGPTPFDGVPT